MITWITRGKTCRNVQGEINSIKELHQNTHNESPRNKTFNFLIKFMTNTKTHALY